MLRQLLSSLFSWFTNKKPPQSETRVLTSHASPPEVQEDWSVSLAVAGTIEAAISAVRWTHRDLEERMPGAEFFVVDKIRISDQGDGQFWLIVCIQTDEGQTMAIPLHEFLQECSPAGELRFEDFQS